MTLLPTLTAVQRLMTRGSTATCFVCRGRILPSDERDRITQLVIEFLATARTSTT